MARTLAPAGNKVRVIGPTTTTNMALRLTSTFRVLAANLPAGLESAVVLDILLALHLAEEDARYLTAAQLQPAGVSSPSVTLRWVEALVRQGSIERRDDLLALSAAGHDMVMNVLERVYAAQRLLD